MVSAARLLIGGKLLPGERVTDVVNPATARAFDKAPRASRDQLDAAVAAAVAAFPSWSNTSINARQEALRAIADALLGAVDELARLLVLEQGKPFPLAREEVLATASFFRAMAGRELLPRVIEDGPTRRIKVVRAPLGVVAAITPWNFPLVLMGLKVPGALLAGNTIVLKPAATTPLSTLRFGELVQRLLPPGVLNVISDENDLGADLVGHPDVRKVSFTGSTETGRLVMAGAAQNLARVTLELGGNDPAIVLADADPKAIAPRIFRAAFRNSGQICMAIKRLYVHGSVLESLWEELAALARAARVGDGFAPDVEFGPLQNRFQFDRVVALLESARASGGEIANGEAPSTGYFVPPTIVRGLRDDHALVREEQFGPVLPVLSFHDDDEAVARANASPYGLGASVWTSDLERGCTIASRIEAGTIWVNKHMELSPDAPFGGAKQSGIGSELGDEGLLEFTQVRVVNVDLGGA